MVTMNGGGGVARFGTGKQGQDEGDFLAIDEGRGRKERGEDMKKTKVGGLRSKRAEKSEWKGAGRRSAERDCGEGARGGIAEKERGERARRKSAEKERGEEARRGSAERGLSRA
jgi:hypothetical protein